MIDSIGGTARSGNSKASSPAASALQVTSSDFLQLLLAQFKYQDPFAPQDPAKSVGELAGLAQLSTLQDISATLQQLAGRSGGIDVASWVRRTGLVEKGTGVPTEDGTYAGRIQTASDADVDISFSAPDSSFWCLVPASGEAGRR